MYRSITLALVTLLSVAFFSAPAEARKRHKHKRAHATMQRVVQAEPCFFICEQAPVTTEYRVTRRGKRVAVQSNRRMVERTAGIVAPLASKVAEIQAACGSTVISGVRHTMIAGTRRWSLHTQGKAVDMVGNPSCIYSHLHGWSGGYSTDYGRMRHVHISYDADGGREMGVRFAHGGHRKHVRRYARHHKHRHRVASK